MNRDKSVRGDLVRTEVHVDLLPNFAILDAKAHNKGRSNGQVPGIAYAGWPSRDIPGVDP